MYFDHEVVMFGQQCTDRDDVLARLAGALVTAGVVRSTYPSAVLEREQTYPTGLQVEGMGVAIPHTDAEHVVTPQLGFLSLATPVDFVEMGSEDSTVPVSLVIMLALPKAEDQIPMLQKLVSMFENGDLLQRLKAATSVEEVTDVFAEAGID